MKPKKNKPFECWVHCKLFIHYIFVAMKILGRKLLLSLILSVVWLIWFSSVSLADQWPADWVCEASIDALTPVSPHDGSLITSQSTLAYWFVAVNPQNVYNMEYSLNGSAFTTFPFDWSTSANRSFTLDNIIPYENILIIKAHPLDPDCATLTKTVTFNWPEICTEEIDYVTLTSHEDYQPVYQEYITVFWRVSPIENVNEVTVFLNGQERWTIASLWTLWVNSWLANIWPLQVWLNTIDIRARSINWYCPIINTIRHVYYNPPVCDQPITDIIVDNFGDYEVTDKKNITLKWSVVWWVASNVKVSLQFAPYSTIVAEYNPLNQKRKAFTVKVKWWISKYKLIATPVDTACPVYTEFFHLIGQFD